MPDITIADLAAELAAQKETIQHLLSQLSAERDDRQKSDAQLTAELAPVGTIAAFAGGTYEQVPKGWLPCKGGSRERAKYPKLFAAIGTCWGHGDRPPDTFNLPDLRGLFLRGVDGGAGKDPDSTSRTSAKPGGNAGNAVGSVQPEGFRKHDHGFNNPGHTHDVKRGFLADGGGGYGRGGLNQGGSDVHDFPDRKTTTLGGNNITFQANGGSETRPANAYVIWLIKADA